MSVPFAPVDLPERFVPFAPEDLPERFQVMKRQEVLTYKVEDYLNPNYQVPRAAPTDLMCMPSSDAESATSSSYSVGTNSSAAGVNEQWRSRICEWSYQVIDHFDYDREIVAVSLSYLDRYLCKRPVNKRTFQLVAMTTLYLACKLYDPNKLRMSSLIERSRGYFTEEHITAMEGSILNKLGWQVHPPTPLTFARHYVLLLKPTACEPAVWHDMMEVAKFLTELAVIDYHFAPLKPSSVGLAALMTAMEGVAEERLAMVDKQNFATSVYHIAQVSPNDPEVMDCRTRLRSTYYEGGIYEQQKEAEAAAAARANRERELATDRIAVDSPTGVNDHPVVQEEAAASNEVNQSIAPAKNGGGSPDAVDPSIATALVSSMAQLQALLDATKDTGISGSDVVDNAAPLAATLTQLQQVLLDASKANDIWASDALASAATLTTSSVQLQAILDATEVNDILGTSSSSSMLAADTTKGNKTTGTDSQGEDEDEAKTKAPVSTCAMIADTAKKLVQDALSSYQKMEGGSKRRKN